MIVMLNILTFACIIGALAFGLSYYNKKIVIELDNRYYNCQDLTQATIAHLQNKGKNCSVTETGLLLVNGKKYFLTERTVNFMTPVQQVILKPFKNIIN